MANTLFPIFVKIDQIKILLVGGGYVGAEKLATLLRNNPQAQITLVADLIREDTEKLIQNASCVQVVRRKFEWNDLDEKDLIILATNNRKLHEEIKAEASRRNILTNVADTPDLCDFYLGSVVQKGDLKIGISTNGKSPTLAKRIREYLEDGLPDDIQDLLDNLEKFRQTLKNDFDHKVKVLNELTEQAFEKRKPKE